jgi:hypothetical protein
MLGRKNPISFLDAQKLRPSMVGKTFSYSQARNEVKNVLKFSNGKFVVGEENFFERISPGKGKTIFWRKITASVTFRVRPPCSSGKKRKFSCPL